MSSIEWEMKKDETKGKDLNGDDDDGEAKKNEEEMFRWRVMNVRQENIMKWRVMRIVLPRYSGCYLL